VVLERTVDIPAALTASLRELHSIRQAQAVVEGAAMAPWIFRSATDPATPMNDAWFRDRVWRPLLEKAEVRHVCVPVADASPRGAHRLRLEAARALLDPGHGGPLRSFPPPALTDTMWKGSRRQSKRPAGNWPQPSRNQIPRPRSTPRRKLAKELVPPG
jgi:hypothetical protein